jgi:hypothetical protein
MVKDTEEHLVVNVFEHGTGRVRFVNPDIRDLMGDLDYPLWFIREVKAQLAAKEPYTVAAGVGMLVVYAPWVVEDYAEVVFDEHKRTPDSLCSDWCDRVARYYRNDIEGSLIYEVDELVEGLRCFATLYARDKLAALYALRSLKLRRDSLESVAWVCLKCARVPEPELNAVDTTAQLYCDLMVDEQLGGAARRLNIAYKRNPKAWWALRPIPER